MKSWLDFQQKQCSGNTHKHINQHANSPYLLSHPPAFPMSHPPQDKAMIGSMVLGLLPIKLIITAENGTCLCVVESKKVSAYLGQDASFIAVIVSPIIWIRT
jgi:hypothetical protein